MAITSKIEVGINSNLLHSIRTQYVSENVIKLFSDFGAIFWKKPWAIALGIFQKLAYFLKWLKLEKFMSESAQTCYRA